MSAIIICVARMILTRLDQREHNVEGTRQLRDSAKLRESAAIFLRSTGYEHAIPITFGWIHTASTIHATETPVRAYTEAKLMGMSALFTKQFRLNSKASDMHSWVALNEVLNITEARRRITAELDRLSSKFGTLWRL